MSVWIVSRRAMASMYIYTDEEKEIPLVNKLHRQLL